MTEVKKAKDLMVTKEEGKESTKVNREYKDRLFKFIFGNNEHKEWTLSLYNAVNGSDYTDSDEIEFNTIEDAVYMSMKNDLSFLIGNSINLYEEQSTFNPNMPMRFLIYTGMVYARYIEVNRNYHRFSSKLQKVPTPKCICFYNGSEMKEDKIILRLSDAFYNPSDSDVELTVTMLNINYNHNMDLLNACMPLKEYSIFVDMIRKNEKTMALDEAVDLAIDELPEESIIKPFLLANRAEVKSMCITEYDEARAFEEQREEGIEEGIKKGIEKGIEKGTEKTLKLIDYLTKAGRLSEVQNAINDKEYRNKLFEEFGIQD